MQPPAEEAMTEHCENQTCSGVAVTVEPAEQSPSRPRLSGDPSGTQTLSQGLVTAIQEAQGHKNSSDLFSQVQELHVHNMDSLDAQSTQETSSVLACKQPTKVCDENRSWEGGAHSTTTRCCCISPTKAPVREAGGADHFPLVGAHLPLMADHHHHFPAEYHLPPPGDQHFPVDDHLPPRDDQAVCCSSYFHNANLNRTFAAYCHPQPIPAPAQVLPQGPPCTTQRAVEPPAVPGHLSLPFLISSIGEMDLDAKHLIQCHNLSCTWSSKPLPPPLPSGPLPPCRQSSMCCTSPAGQAPITSRDTGTMTTLKVLRDVAVQTGQTTSSHVFPHICLADDNRSDTSAAKTLQPDQNKTPGGALKSPIREVKWDAEGMTWEVYGASVDPEELGLAIQKHLEQQIKETASRAAKLAHQNTSSRQRGWLVASFRGPGCCSRRTTAKD